MNKEREQYTKNSEKECRERRMGGVDFSLEVIVWKKRRDLWNSVIRYHKGAWINRAITKIREKACGIQRPLGIKLTEDKRAYMLDSTAAITRSH